MMKKFRTLLASEEAQRQLTMGKALDPSRPVAPTVPILEEIFADKDLYTQSSDEVAPPKYPPVTPKTAFATSPTEIRGCNALVVGTIFDKQVLRKCGTWQNFGPACCVYYFPPWHEISQTRRSRPALVGVRSMGLPFNGENNKYVQELGNKNSAGSKSMNPLDYAIWRQASVRLFRKALFQAFNHHSVTTNPSSLDGMYLVSIRKVPTEAEAVEIMRKFVGRVANSDLRWADRPGGINMANLERMLLRSNYPPMAKHTNRNDWV